MDCPIGFIECKYKVKTCSVCLRQQFDDWLEEHDKKIRTETIEEYKEQLLKDLIPLKDKYFDIARGAAMPERYIHLKRMDTVDMIIETVNLIAARLKE